MKKNENKTVKKNNESKNLTKKVVKPKTTKKNVKVKEAKKDAIEKSDTKKDNKRKIETIILMAIALLVGVLIGECSTKGNEASIKTVSDENINKFVTNYEYILNNYYKKVDSDKLINAAITGMIDLLDDPYSTVIDESESNTFSITLEGSYEGLGLKIAKLEDTGYMYVGGVFKDSPAEKAGMKVGDLIVSINGKESKNLTSAEFGEYVTKGTETIFNLSILRDDKEKIITIEKNHVEIESIKTDVIEKSNKKIGYIYIGIFANNTLQQFEKALKEIESKNIDALIIDVRGNSGGRLTSVDGILDLFLNSKQVMYQFQTSKKISKVYGTGNEEKKNYEIVLLGDEASASASEVLISGLRDNFNYKFIGKKTYGKGSVQEMITLSSDLKAKITTKSWLTPNGKNLTEEKGIKPDIEVIMDEKYYDTYSLEDDNQYNRAIEYIVNGK